MKNQKDEQLCKLGDEADVSLKTDTFKLTVNQPVDSSLQRAILSFIEDF